MQTIDSVPSTRYSSPFIDVVQKKEHTKKQQTQNIYSQQSNRKKAKKKIIHGDWATDDILGETPSYIIFNFYF